MVEPGILPRVCWARVAGQGKGEVGEVAHPLRLEPAEAVAAVAVGEVEVRADLVAEVASDY